MADNAKDNLYDLDGGNSVEQTESLYYSSDETETVKDNTLYNLEEEERMERLASEDNEAWKGETFENSRSVLLLLLKVLTTPVEGWKELKRSRLKEDAVASRCFYPLIALAAASEFTGIFYEAHFTVSEGVIKGIITFMTFFFGYFSVLLLGGIFLPKDLKERLNSYYGKEYVMLNISTLALFYIVFRIFPILGPVVAFLPLWTIYIASKGVKIFRVEENLKVRVATVLSGLILGCPILWNWILTELLPQNI